MKKYLFCFLFLIQSISIAGETVYARITGPFEVIPANISLFGTDAGGNPYPCNMIIQPRSGYTTCIFPATPGSTVLQIPEQTIYFPSYFPPTITGPGGFLAPISISPDGFFHFSVTFPAMTVNLPYPIPNEDANIIAPVTPALNLKIEQLPFIITTYTLLPPLSPISLQSHPPGQIQQIPMMPISFLNISIEKNDYKEYHGELNYSLNVKSDNPTGTWSWNIAGTWRVTIYDYNNSSSYADLKHQQAFNITGGSLTSVTDVTIPPILNRSVEKLTNSFNIQFSKQEPGGKHILTFNNSISGQDNTQTFNPVAYIALGQWMRKMGNPSLKVDTPHTSNNPITWSVTVSPNQEMTLVWHME